MSSFSSELHRLRNEFKNNRGPSFVQALKYSGGGQVSVSDGIEDKRMAMIKELRTFLKKYEVCIICGELKCKHLEEFDWEEPEPNVESKGRWVG